jgi:uncharacterized delta-60 repeat protein
MNRKFLRPMAVPIIAICMALADCSGGTSTTSGPTTAYAVLRLNSDGAPDTTFAGGRAIAVTDIDPALFDFALAVAVEPAPSNKIIAAGSSGFAGQGVIALVRYNTDGSVDTSFGAGGIARPATPQGWTSASATAIAVQPDNKIVVAALTFNASTSATGIALFRYNTNGTLDTTFGTSGVVTPAAIGLGLSSDTCALGLQADGKIVVAGASQSGDIVLYRYDGTGTPDPSFGTSGTVGKSIKNLATPARSPAIAFQSSGKIIVATGTDKDEVVMRFGNNGVLDTSFGTSGTGIVTTDIGGSVNYANAVAVQSNDKIVVAGHANLNFQIDASDISLVKYNPDGTLDISFVGDNPNPNPPGIVTSNLNGKFDNALSITLQAQAVNEPLILVSGNTGSAGFTQTAVLRYNPDGSLDTSFGPTQEGVVIVQLAGPSNVASGNAIALQPVGNGFGIVVAGYD